MFPVERYQMAQAVISSGFRSPSRPDHDGVDITWRADSISGQNVVLSAGGKFAAPAQGAYAVAWRPGVVTRVNRHDDGQVSVYLDHADTWQSRYLHLQQTDVQVGDWLEEGARVGEIGRGPRSMPHLHFELLYGGERVDPAPYLATEAPPERPTAALQTMLALLAAAIAAGVIVTLALRVNNDEQS